MSNIYTITAFVSIFKVKERAVTYRILSTVSCALSHKLIPCKGGLEVNPSILFSTEGPSSWTSLTDSDSRLSRFTKAITSFRCSCSCKKEKEGYTKYWSLRGISDKRCLLKISTKVHKTYRRVWVYFTINGEKNLQCSSKTKNLKFSPKTTFLASNTIHQSTEEWE